MDHLLLPGRILANLDLIWTFWLLVIRFAAMMMFIPGLNQGGDKGMKIRTSGIMILAYASVLGADPAPLPEDWLLLMGAMFSEALLGTMLGIIPAMIISGLLLGGQLAATTMGLGAAQLVDPTMGINVSSVGRMFGDTMICAFLLLGGHHLIIYAASGLGGEIIPGTFLLGESSIGMLIDRSSQIFTIGVMISAPILVALLLTQFVMGLISKAVPQVNIFIVSFPLTIGIGLILAILSLPEISVFTEKEFNTVEGSIASVVVDLERREES